MGSVVVTRLLQTVFSAIDSSGVGGAIARRDKWTLNDFTHLEPVPIKLIIWSVCVCEGLVKVLMSTNNLSLCLIITASLNFMLIAPPHPNSSSYQCGASLLLANTPVDLRPLGQRCHHGNKVSRQRRLIQTQPGVVLLTP